MSHPLARMGVVKNSPKARSQSDRSQNDRSQNDRSQNNRPQNSSLRFAEAARTLSDTARATGFRAPSFRSPPRIGGDRSIRRQAKGGATVAVRYRDRPWPAVLADMVEGVVVTNEAAAEAADTLRRDLWAALERVSGPGETVHLAAVA